MANVKCVAQHGSYRNGVSAGDSHHHVDRNLFGAEVQSTDLVQFLPDGDLGIAVFEREKSDPRPNILRELWAVRESLPDGFGPL